MGSWEGMRLVILQSHTKAVTNGTALLGPATTPPRQGFYTSIFAMSNSSELNRKLNWQMRKQG
jgi:hypothetical protein